MNKLKEMLLSGDEIFITSNTSLTEMDIFNLFFVYPKQDNDVNPGPLTFLDACIEMLYYNWDIYRYHKGMPYKFVPDKTSLVNYLVSRPTHKTINTLSDAYTDISNIRTVDINDTNECIGESSLLQMPGKWVSLKDSNLLHWSAIYKPCSKYRVTGADYAVISGISDEYKWLRNCDNNWQVLKPSTDDDARYDMSVDADEILRDLNTSATDEWTSVPLPVKLSVAVPIGHMVRIADILADKSEYMQVTPHTILGVDPNIDSDELTNLAFSLHVNAHNLSCMGSISRSSLHPVQMAVYKWVWDDNSKLRLSTLIYPDTVTNTYKGEWKMLPQCPGLSNVGALSLRNYLLSDVLILTEGDAQFISLIYNGTHMHDCSSLMILTQEQYFNQLGYDKYAVIENTTKANERRHTLLDIIPTRMALCMVTTEMALYKKLTNPRGTQTLCADDKAFLKVDDYHSLGTALREIPHAAVGLDLFYNENNYWSKGDHKPTLSYLDTLYQYDMKYLHNISKALLDRNAVVNGTAPNGKIFVPDCRIYDENKLTV